MLSKCLQILRGARDDTGINRNPWSLFEISVGILPWALYFYLCLSLLWAVWTMNPMGPWVDPETHIFQCNLLHIVVWCLETDDSKWRVFFQPSLLGLPNLFWTILVRCMRRVHQTLSCPACEKSPLKMFNSGSFGECLLINIFMELQNRVRGKEHLDLPSQFADEETEIRVKSGLVLVAEQEGIHPQCRIPPTLYCLIKWTSTGLGTRFLSVLKLPDGEIG